MFCIIYFPALKHKFQILLWQRLMLLAKPVEVLAFNQDQDSLKYLDSSHLFKYTRVTTLLCSYNPRDMCLNSLKRLNQAKNCPIPLSISAIAKNFLWLKAKVLRLKRLQMFKYLRMRLLCVLWFRFLKLHKQSTIPKNTRKSKTTSYLLEWNLTWLRLTWSISLCTYFGHSSRIPQLKMLGSSQSLWTYIESLHLHIW